MAKVKKVGKKKGGKETTPKLPGPKLTGKTANEKRGLQVEKKAAFLKKIAASKQSGGIQKRVSAKRKNLPDLATLGEALQEVQQQKLAEAAQQAGSQPEKLPGANLHSAKARQRVAVQESERLKAVLKHPLYKVDPIKAITNHLNNTLPPVVAPAQHKAKAGAKRKK